MMDHLYEQSKDDINDNSPAGECDREQPTSYYYDDAANYEPYSEDDDDDDGESSTPTASATD